MRVALVKAIVSMWKTKVDEIIREIIVEIDFVIHYKYSIILMDYPKIVSSSL